MSIRALFLVVGAAWGVLIGGLVGLAAFVFAFGGAWPGATNWVLPAFAVLAGFLTFALCAAAGWYYGARAGAPTADRRRARRTGLGLLGLYAAAIVAIVVMSVTGIGRQVADRDQGEAQAAAFAQLFAARHTIDRIGFFGWNAESGSAGIVMRGNRDGDYRISWQVLEPISGQVLAQGRKTVSLGPGRRTVVIPLARDGLIEAYREKVLKGAGGVVVDEAFRLTATVEPVLSPEESAALPPREVRNLAIGQSSLRSDVGIDVLFSFQLPAAPTVRTD